MTITTSAQDITAALKRRVIAKTYVANPPAKHQRFNSVYVSVVANKGLVMNNTVGGGHTYTNTCCVT